MGSKDHNKVVFVNAIDPQLQTGSVRRWEWVIGEDIPQEMVEQFRDPDSGELYAVIVYQKGEPDVHVVAKKQWFEIYEQVCGPQENHKAFSADAQAEPDDELTSITVLGQDMEQAREWAAFIQGVIDEEGANALALPMIVVPEVLREKAITALPAVLIEGQVVAMGNRPDREEIRLWLQWPKTVEEAVAHILAMMPAEELRKSLENEVASYDLGAGIRNSLGLWGANKALLKACGSGDISADDASSVIIEALKRKLLTTQAKTSHEKERDLESGEGQGTQVFPLHPEEVDTVQELIAIVRRLLRRPDVTSGQLPHLRKLLHALERLPYPTHAIDIELTLSSRVNENLSYQSVEIYEDSFTLSSGESIYGPVVGTDTHTQTDFEVSIDGFRSAEDLLALDGWLEWFGLRVDGEANKLEIESFGEDSEIEWDHKPESDR